MEQTGLIYIHINNKAKKMIKEEVYVVNTV